MRTYDIDFSDGSRICVDANTEEDARAYAHFEAERSGSNSTIVSVTDTTDA